jgi:hypothetical protein
LFIIVSPFDCGARLFGANSEVRRIQRRCERRFAPPRSYPSLLLEGAHRRPRRIEQQSSIYSSPFRGRNASVRLNQLEKKSLKLARVQKKAANSRKFAAILPERPASGHRKLASAAQGQSAVSAR